MVAYSEFRLLILSEFTITSNELADMPSAAIHGVSQPATAAGNARTL
jgi:hypothetical protein